MFKQFLQNTTPKNQDLKKLYLLIHKYGPITKADLIEKTEIKKTTLVRMIDELLKCKFIEECGLGESFVGRRPILYDVVRNGNYLIGIHISRMKTNIVLLNLRYDQIDQESFIMTTMHTPEFVMLKIKNIIENFMEKHHFDQEKLMGIGLAVIGPLNRAEGMILKPESFLAANWNHVPIVKLIQQAFPVKVVLEKGANAAAVAEYHANNYLYENILYCVSGGWGIDCGVVVNGMILPDQYADQSGYGHMIVDLNGNICSCGKRGCIVSYTSFQSIVRQLESENALLGNMSKELFQKASLTEMMEYFKQGDKKTERIILESARYLGIGLSNLLNLFRSEIIILNGPFLYEFDGYYEQVVDNIAENIHEEKEVIFSQGWLQENAAAIGAAILLFESYFKDLNFSSEKSVAIF
ncbi:ROK family protein [Alkalihalobacillus deserti]|uniref:ROK family protein n=1 Tax=Alkalihalobacillus deserti TaxID=2879466 RepID=UPI001D15B4B1|nr:ROK family protein [Alkalihalobacillus deserti]